MGLRTTLVLLLAVGGLAAALVFTDEKTPTKENAEIAALDGRSLTDCKRVRWQFHMQGPVEVARGEDGRFSIVEPLVDLVSPGYLKQIFTTWDSAKMRRTPLLDDAAGRQKAGLVPPELTFLAEFPDGQRFQFEVGAQGPLGTSRFLRRDGVIWEGGDALLESMRVGLDDLRDRAVFRHTESLCGELRVEQLLATGKRETLHLKREKAEWRLLAPIAARADTVAATQFLTAVLSLRVDNFPPGIVRYPEREPEIVIVARGAFGEETVRLWEEQGSVFGALPGRGGITFSSDNRQYGAIFLNAAEQLRAKILVPLQVVAEDLAEVVIDPGQGRGDRLRLVRASTGEPWRLLEPVQFAAHPTPCNELVQAINNLHARQFVDGRSASEPEFGLGAGRLQVAVRGFDQKAATNLWFGADLEQNGQPLTYACREDEVQGVVLVPQPAVVQLRRPWTAYCALDVVRLPTAVERLELLPRQGERRVFLRDATRWIKEGSPESRDEVGGFVNDVLRDLRGDRAVDLRSGNFGDPDWLLRMCRANGDTLAELRLWDRSKEAPMVVQTSEQGQVGIELPPWIGKTLRELWQ